MQTQFFDELKGQTLDEAMIKKIQAESGKDVTDAKAKAQVQIDNLSEQVNTLNGQIAKHQGDIKSLTEQLSQAGQDADKLNSIQEKFSALQEQYKKDTEAYQEKLNKQQYEFLAKENMNGIEFSCNAAKKDFLEQLTAKNLPIHDGKMIGFNEFVEAFKQSTPDSFKATKKEKDDEKPNFAPPVKSSKIEKEKENMFGFNSYIGVRPQKKE